LYYYYYFVRPFSFQNQWQKLSSLANIDQMSLTWWRRQMNGEKWKHELKRSRIHRKPHNNKDDGNGIIFFYVNDVNSQRCVMLSVSS
jgi:hypothetical protein